MWGFRSGYEMCRRMVELGGTGAGCRGFDLSA